jgi:hypothetical protein
VVTAGFAQGVASKDSRLGRIDEDGLPPAGKRRPLQLALEPNYKPAPQAVTVRITVGERGVRGANDANSTLLPFLSQHPISIRCHVKLVALHLLAGSMQKFAGHTDHESQRNSIAPCSKTDWCDGFSHAKNLNRSTYTQVLNETHCMFGIS